MQFAASHANDHYPPHNIIKENDNEYLIELAVAGFTKDDIEISQKERSLKITGKYTSKGREVIHRGISTRNFERRFRLSEYVQVTEASFSGWSACSIIEVGNPRREVLPVKSISIKRGNKMFISR